MSVLLRLCCSLVVLPPSLVLAATLETPGNGDNLSGIGVIRGWKCEAVGDITVRFDGGNPVALVYGNERGDTSGVCGDTTNGFVAIFNWALLDDGEHTAVAYDNGVEFARSTFEVTTLGEEFVTGAVGECRMLDFPSPGKSTVWEWNEATQGVEALGVGDFAPATQAAFDSRMVGKRAIDVSVSLEYIDYVSAGRLEYDSSYRRVPGAYSYEKTGPTTATLTVDYEGTGPGTHPHCVYQITFTSPTTGTYHAPLSWNCWEGWDDEHPVPVPVNWELADIGETLAPANQAAFESRMVGKRLILPGDYSGSYVLSGGRFTSHGYPPEDGEADEGTYGYDGWGRTIGQLSLREEGEDPVALLLVFATPTSGAYIYHVEGQFTPISVGDFYITEIP